MFENIHSVSFSAYFHSRLKKKKNWEILIMFFTKKNQKKPQANTSPEVKLTGRFMRVSWRKIIFLESFNFISKK